MNTWPGGKRHAIHQCEHEAWNAAKYPGTQQLCCDCNQPTERCEEDAIYTEEDGSGPLCRDCYHQTAEYLTDQTRQLQDHGEPNAITEAKAEQMREEGV